MTAMRRLTALGVPIGALVLLSACNLPTRPSPQDIASTAAAETVSAQLTQLSLATPTVPPTNTPEPPPAATETPPATAIPPTATVGCSDNSQFVADVTIPDNTSMTPGQTFSKTWRLRNTGTCAWGPEFDVVFIDGNAMGGPASVPLAGPVPPGGTVDVSVNLTAPSTNGTHRGNWRLRNERDVLFGTAFFVQIVVGPTPTPTVSVHKTGKVTLASGSTVDLDSGASPGGGDADLWYEFVSPVEQYLTPQSGATFKEMGSTPTFAQCQGAALSGAKVNFTDLSVGDVFCYKTSAGRFGRMEVESMGATSILLDFRTWK